MAILTTTDNSLLDALSLRPNDSGVDVGDLSFNGEAGSNWQDFDLDEAAFSEELGLEYLNIEALEYFDQDPLSGENMSVLVAAENTFGETDLFLQSYTGDFTPLAIEMVDITGASIPGYSVPDYQAAFFRTPSAEGIDPTESHFQENRIIALGNDASEGSTSAIDPENDRPRFPDPNHA